MTDKPNENSGTVDPKEVLANEAAQDTLKAHLEFQKKAGPIDDFDPKTLVNNVKNRVLDSLEKRPKSHTEAVEENNERNFPNRQL